MPRPSSWQARQTLIDWDQKLRFPLQPPGHLTQNFQYALKPELCSLNEESSEKMKDSKWLESIDDLQFPRSASGWLSFLLRSFLCLSIRAILGVVASGLLITNCHRGCWFGQISKRLAILIRTSLSFRRNLYRGSVCVCLLHHRPPLHNRRH